MQGILLAAGFGRRFQKEFSGPNEGLVEDKLLTKMADGKPVLWHSAHTLISTLPNSLAVVQPQQLTRKKILEDLGFNVIESKRAAKGMGYAIADAVRCSKESEGWLIALADMPWISTDLIKTFIEQQHKQHLIVAPRFNGRRGQPVFFDNVWRQKLEALQGDTGARDILKTATIEWIDWHDDSIHKDVDSPKDIQPQKN